MREDSKSFTTGLNRQFNPIIHENKTKINFRTYLEHIEKDLRNPKPI